MTLVKSKSSCFIDAIEVALGANAATLARDYRDIIGESDHDPDDEGYHPSVVNQCLLERFGRGLAEIDMLPVDEDGEPYSDDPSMYVSGWFRRPNFQCVITGERENGEEHAIGFKNGRFFDSNGVELDAPNIKLRSVWVLGIPKIDLPSTEEGGE